MPNNITGLSQIIKNLGEETPSSDTELPKGTDQSGRRFLVIQSKENAVGTTTDKKLASSSRRIHSFFKKQASHLSLKEQQSLRIDISQQIKILEKQPVEKSRFWGIFQRSTPMSKALSQLKAADKELEKAISKQAKIDKIDSKCSRAIASSTQFVSELDKGFTQENLLDHQLGLTFHKKTLSELHDKYGSTPEIAQQLEHALNQVNYNLGLIDQYLKPDAAESDQAITPDDGAAIAAKLHEFRTPSETAVALQKATTDEQRVAALKGVEGLSEDEQSMLVAVYGAQSSFVFVPDTEALEKLTQPDTEAQKLTYPPGGGIEIDVPDDVIKRLGNSYDQYLGNESLSNPMQLASGWPNTHDFTDFKQAQIIEELDLVVSHVEQKIGTTLSDKARANLAQTFLAGSTFVGIGNIARQAGTKLPNKIADSLNCEVHELPFMVAGARAEHQPGEYTPFRFTVETTDTGPVLRLETVYPYYLNSMIGTTVKSPIHFGVRATMDIPLSGLEEEVPSFMNGQATMTPFRDTPHQVLAEECPWKQPPNMTVCLGKKTQ